MKQLGLHPDDYDRLYRKLRNTPSRLHTENNLYRRWVLRDEAFDQAPPLMRFLVTGKLQAGPAQASVGKDDWEVTRGIWHLFLRWLDDHYTSVRVLSIRRDGRITPHPRN
jgi:hypothetical protein